MKIDLSTPALLGWFGADARAIRTILELPGLLNRSSLLEGGYQGPVWNGTAHIGVIDDMRIIVVVISAAGQDKDQLVCRIYGASDSEAHWFPFEPIYEQLSEKSPPPRLDLTVTKERLATLISTTSVWPSDRCASDMTPMTTAIVTYISRASGVSLPLHINCELPLEIMAEDAERSFPLDSIAVMMNDVRPAAVLTSEEGDIPYVWIRPAVISFDTPSEGYSLASRRAAKIQLADYGVSPDQLVLLDELAGEIRDSCDDDSGFDEDEE